MEEKDLSIQEPTEKELLKELLEEQKRSSNRLLINAIAIGVIAVIFLVSTIIIVPKAVRTLNASNQLIVEAEGSLDGIEQMIQNANRLLDENEDSVSEVINSIKGLDFDSLNNSIRDFSNVISGLSKIADIFK